MENTKAQAAAQYQTIAALVAALNCDFDRLEELKDERESLVYDYSEAHEDQNQDHRQAEQALAAWDDDNAQELNELEHQAGEFENAEEAAQAIQEHALSAEVRSGWASIGDKLTAEEFRIVVCTGGPHVEICGEFDVHGQPYRAWLQYQDWGTPMTQYFETDEDTLITYCQQFFF